MSDYRKRAILARDIALCLQRQGTAMFADSSLLNLGRGILLTGMALVLLQPDQAAALELGELKVNSAVGQPFSASTTARIGTGESLNPNCVTSVNPNSDLRYSRGLRVAVPATNLPGEHPVKITSVQPLYEPMYEIRLQVNCPGTMTLAKTYLVMLNLPLPAPVSASPRTVAGGPNTESPQPETPVESRLTTGDRIQPPDTVSQGATNSPASTAQVDSGTLAADSSSLQPSQDYRVRQGDTLFAIANRMEGRQAGSTWDIANEIFALNPHAFIGNNPDLIKLGASIALPDNGVVQQAGVEAPSVPGPAENQPLETATDNVFATEIVARENESQAVEKRPNTTNVATDTVIDDPTVIASDGETPAASLQEQSKSATQLREIPLDSLPAKLAADQNAAPVSDNAFANRSAEAPASSGTNPLWIALSGMLVGLLLIALFFGRRLVKKFAPGRSESAAQTITTADADEHAETYADDSEDLFANQDSADDRAAFDELESTNDSTGGIAASEAQAIEAGSVDFDLEIGSAGADETPDITSLADSPEFDQSPAAAPEEPRIDLQDADNAEQLTGFDSYEESSDNNSEGFDGEGTIRNLFDELDPTGDGAPTEEFAPIADDATTEELPDLQSLATDVDKVDPDDKASQTLSDALDLLTQDYEDELTASQILDAEEVRDAFAAHSVDKD